MPLIYSWAGLGRHYKYGNKSWPFSGRGPGKATPRRNEKYWIQQAADVLLPDELMPGCRPSVFLTKKKQTLFMSVITGPLDPHPPPLQNLLSTQTSSTTLWMDRCQLHVSFGHFFTDQCFLFSSPKLNRVDVREPSTLSTYSQSPTPPGSPTLPHSTYFHTSLPPHTQTQYTHNNVELNYNEATRENNTRERKKIKKHNTIKYSSQTVRRRFPQLLDDSCDYLITALCCVCSATLYTPS